MIYIIAENGLLVNIILFKYTYPGHLKKTADTKRPGLGFKTGSCLGLNK